MLRNMDSQHKMVLLSSMNSTRKVTMLRSTDKLMAIAALFVPSSTCA